MAKHINSRTNKKLKEATIKTILEHLNKSRPFEVIKLPDIRPKGIILKGKIKKNEFKIRKINYRNRKGDPPGY